MSIFKKHKSKPVKGRERKYIDDVFGSMLKERTPTSEESPKDFPGPGEDSFVPKSAPLEASAGGEKVLSTVRESIMQGLAKIMSEKAKASTPEESRKDFPGPAESSFVPKSAPPEGSAGSEEMTPRQKMAVASDERRRDFRRPAENSIVLRFALQEDSAGGENVLSTVTKDMSPGGAKIMAEQTIPHDVTLELELLLPEMQKTVAMKGKVKWIKGAEEDKQFELGLEFVNPPSESMLSLLEYTYKK